MTDTDTAAIIVDQFVAAPPQKVWRTLTEPALLAKWWAPGDISATPGHWWRLEAEGTGTRVFLEHSGFDLGDKRMADAFTRMGPGWRDQVLPQVADVAARAAWPARPGPTTGAQDIGAGGRASRLTANAAA